MRGSLGPSLLQRCVVLAGSVVLTVVMASCSGGTDTVSFSGQERPEPSPTNIIEILGADEGGRFTTLAAAVGASEVAKEALAGPGPLTLFAPTNAAFDALPDGTVEALLEDKDALDQILLGHAVAGTLDAGTVVGSSSLTAANGMDLVVGDGPSIGGSTIVETDVAAPNGVIHVIDAVILPPTEG